MEPNHVKLNLVRVRNRLVLWRVRSLTHKASLAPMPHFTRLEKPLQLSITSIPKPLQWTSSMGILFLFFDKQTKKKKNEDASCPFQASDCWKYWCKKNCSGLQWQTPKKALNKTNPVCKTCTSPRFSLPCLIFTPEHLDSFFFQRPTLCRIWGSKSPGSHLQWPPRATWWHLGCERMKPLMGAGRIQGRIDQAGCGDKVIYFSSRLKPPPIKKQRSSFQDLKKKKKKRILKVSCKVWEQRTSQ